MGSVVLGGRERVRVAVVQAAPAFMDKKGCLEKACLKIAEAAAEGAELILFPETWIPTFPYWSMGFDSDAVASAEVLAALQDNSLVVGSEDTEILGRAARSARAYVVMGCNELDDRKGSRTLFNSLVYFDRQGRVMGRHRKLVPTYIERIYWGRGDARDLKVFDTDIGRLGGQICWENHMINVTAWFIAQGVDIQLAVWPGHWSNGVRPGESLTSAGRDINACDLTCATREHAFAGQCFVLSASTVATLDDVPDDFPFKHTLTYSGTGQGDNLGVACGGSHIVAPSSEFLVPPVFDQEVILYADLEAKSIKVMKAVFDALGHYTRWDLVRLTAPPAPYEPLEAPRGTRLDADAIRQRLVQAVADELDIDEARVDEIFERALA